MYDTLDNFVNNLNIESISEQRKEILQPLSEFIQLRLDQRLHISLHFICTHNSRRSHLCQVSAQLMAYHFKVNAVNCYSGGTEHTDPLPMAVEPIKADGIQTDTPD